MVECLTIYKKGSALSHRDDLYETPKLMVKSIEQETGLKFNIDVCANNENKKCHYYIGEEDDSLKVKWKQSSQTVVFCNPPRSKNGKFVTKAYNEWCEDNIDIVMLLCWNDLGNKYGEKYLFPYILSGEIKVGNLGKVIFDKHGVQSKFPSRLTYFWVWFRSKH